MSAEPRSADAAPGGPLEKSTPRLHPLGLLSRTTLLSAFVVVMAVDLLLLRSAPLHLPITAGQSALLGLALWMAVQRERHIPDNPAMRRSPRTLAYLASLCALASLALAEKLWIALRADLSQRQAYTASYRVMGATLTLAGVLLIAGGGKRLARYFAAFAEQPARQTALSFLGLAVFGAFLLTLPICVRAPDHVSFVDALFTATSAVCVTGLVVHGLAAEYTAWGQAVILMLMQVGGLGIMVLSASLLVLTGRKLRVRSSAVLAEVLDTESLSSLRGTIVRIVAIALTFEALGALALYVAFERLPEIALGADHPHPLAGSGSRAWAAVFHAVSAFCNAGFALPREGWVPLAKDYDVCAIVMILVVLGGLGFPVLSEIMRLLRARVQRERPQRVTLHTRVVLMATAVLIVGVTVCLSLVEWNGAFADQRWYDRIFSALFHSVALRSGGFSTVDMARFSDAGLMICMLFMFVGAAPGGTGGGIKVTTFAVLAATLRAELRGGSDEPSLFDRRLPAGTVRRAISVAFVAVVVLTLSVLVLLLSERAPAMHVAFEAVSAFNIVGLSTGLTPELSSFGKLFLSLTMLIGRVGPLTVAIAASERTSRAHHRRPHERVLIG